MATTPQSGVAPKTPVSKKRKIQQDDSDTSGDEVHVSRREMRELTISPTASRQDSLNEGSTRKRRAASSRISQYVKQEATSEDGDEETRAESDISEFGDEMGV